MSEFLHSGLRSLGVPMLYAALEEDLREGLRKQSALIRFSDGQLIQQRGDEAEGFWLIEEGSVAVGQFLADGEFRGIALLGPGDSYGELALFSRRPRVVDAVSRGESSARFIRGPAFERLLADNPAAMRRLLGAMAAQLQETLDIVAGLRRGTARARVTGMLANLCAGMNGRVQLYLKQQELGELLGLTRATVNGVLREMEDAGLIERGYGKITVSSPSQLRGAAID